MSFDGYLCSADPAGDIEDMDYRAVQRVFAPHPEKGPINRNAWHQYIVSSGKMLCGITLSNPEIAEDDAHFYGEYIRLCQRCAKEWRKGEWWNVYDYLPLARQQAQTKQELR